MNDINKDMYVDTSMYGGAVGSVENDDYKNMDVVLNTLPIKIMLAFNSQFKITDSGDVENAVEFNYSLIASNPVLANVANSTKFKLPYFTNNVMYPEDVLLSNGPAYAIEFFFEKERFEQVLIRNSANTYINDKDPNASDPNSEVAKALNDNATYNVNLMLKILLPIGSEFGFALTSSFHRYIKHDYISNIFPASSYDVERLFNTTKWIITSNGNTEYVQNVIWASSILDNPNYFYFLYVYNNSLVRRRNLRNQIDDDYSTRITGLMKNLWINQIPGTDSYPGSKNIFDLILIDLKEKLNGRGDYKRSEYDDLLKTLLKEFPADNENKLSNYLNDFIKENGTSSVIGNVEGIIDINRTKINDAIKDTRQMEKIQTIINSITRMHVFIHEYRESVRKSTTGTKQFNFDSQVSSKFDSAYRECIQTKGMFLIKKFIYGEEQYLNLSEKTASGQDKTVEELDIIKYISNSNAQYRELNDAISRGMQNVFPPRREIINKLLQEKLLKIKINSERATQAQNNKNVENICTKAQTTPDFFRDVYSKYFYENKGYNEFDLDALFVGISIHTSSQGVRNFEIFVVVDTVDKDKYDNADKAKCLVNDDILSNAFLNAVSTKSKDRIGFIRNHDALNKATITKTKTKRDNTNKKQFGGTRRKYK